MCFKRFYSEQNVTAIFLPPDAGVARSRNAALAEVDTEFVLLADDDFIFHPTTSLAIPTAILDNDPEVDIIGGLLQQIDGELDFAKSYPRSWERFFLVDRPKGLLVSLPIDLFFPIERSVNGHRYLLCDAVMNWAVLRTSVFARGAIWDQRFTCNGEHEDFYINLKLNTNVKVAYSDEFVAFHHHPEDSTYSVRRNNQEGWCLLGEKWTLRQYLDVPFGLRLFETGETVYRQLE
jgi:glycosyltransferase involved in cell wall biosynthesis